MHKAVLAFTIITFREYQIAKYSVTHACPVWMHENATVAEDALHRGRSSQHTVNCTDKFIQILKLFIRNYVLQGGIW